MSFSSIFINRPVATTLLSIGIAIAGLISFNLLPVASLPDTEIPIISIKASLPGASPENMASSVTTPLELSLSRVSSVTNMTSTSTLGSSQIIIQFDLNRNIDGAARDVQAAINSAQANLPSAMISTPSYQKVNPANAPILIYSLTSNYHSKAEIYDIASTTLQQKLLKVEGVGQVIIAGSSLPAIRVGLNIDAMNKYGISVNQVIDLIKNNNVNLAKGQITSDNSSYEISANDQLFKAEDFAELIVKTNGSAIIRLEDIATIENSVQNTKNSALVNGEPSVLMVIFKSPGSNVIATNNRIKQAFEEIKTEIPANISTKIVLDRTTTIFASLKEVEKTLFGAIIFVIIVVYLFLRNLRSTLIPAIAMMLSLLGTFSVIWFLGFSLNILSMMALAISTGFIIDDAIVVLENISRHIEKGMSPKAAAIQGAKEITSTVISISLALIAVFLPILFMPGIIGSIFREFAVTLSVAILISLILSLTLTPMMCANILKKTNSLKLFDSFKEFYKKTILWSLNNSRIMIGAAIFTFILNIYLFTAIPKEFFPQQDTGRIICSLVADQNASFKSLNENFAGYINIIKKDPEVDNVIGFINSSSVYTATIYIILKQNRTLTSNLIMARIRKDIEHISGATLYMQVAQDLQIGGRISNAQYQYTISGNSLEELNRYIPQIMKRVAKIPGIIDLNNDQENKGLQSFIKIDHDRAARLRVSMQNIDTTLYALYGQSPISIMYKNNNQYYVVTEISKNYLQNPEILKKIYILNDLGILVPLAAFAQVEEGATALAINHQNIAPSVTLSFNLLPGYALGDIVKKVNAALHEMSIPVQAAFSGTAQAFQDMLKNEAIFILAAILAVYLILGMLYESLIHPLTIISSLPSAGVGALLALSLGKTSLSVVAIIGVILLVGIVAKNAIMMIDFVTEIKKYQPNINSKEAIYQAAITRLRPIMMTSISAFLGAVPMLINSGSASQIYYPLGVAIIGGLIMSQILTLYTTPAIYLALENFRKDPYFKL